LKDNKKKKLPVLLSVICILILLPVLITLVIRMESEQPSIKLDLESKFLGLDKELEIVIEDHKSGLKRFWVAILQDGKETTLLEKHFPVTGILKKGTVNSDSVRVKISPE